MKAIISANDKRVEDDISTLRAVGVDVSPGDLVRLTQTSSLPYFPLSGETGSIYWRHTGGVFDQILIGPSVRLLDSAWTRAFLRNAFRMSTSKGQVLKVEGAVDAPAATGKWESILDWWYDSVHEVLIAEMMLRANQHFQHWVRSDDIFLEFLDESAERVIGGSRKKLAEENFWSQVSSTNLEPALKRAMSGQSYYVGGIGYKAPIMKQIIDDHLAGRPFNFIDFGGGYGLLAAELGLTMSNATEVVVRDPSTTNLVFAEQLYRGFRERLRGKFYFSLGKADDFTFDRKFGVISFFASFLYVAPDQQQQVLEKCWDALDDGGILVMHENIKHPSFKADFEKMFTVESIDALLGQFGPIQRYMSTTVKKVTAEQAADKTVFRVVQKA